jgi:hypothetical protein
MDDKIIPFNKTMKNIIHFKHLSIRGGNYFLSGLEVLIKKGIPNPVTVPKSFFFLQDIVGMRKKN